MPEIANVITNDKKQTNTTIVTVIDEPTQTQNKPIDKKTNITKKTETNETNKLKRPPLEMITRDIQTYILEQNICDKNIVKLEYKCGKIIFGIKNEEGKDFRVIAYKARKKTKTVAGKSRGIFYFGITKDGKEITKNHKGTTITKFGKCSVQVEKPIELTLDKTTFNENFDQNAETTITILKSLVDTCVLHKTEQWKEIQEKKQAKLKEIQEKTEAKKLAAEKKAKAITEAKTKKKEKTTTSKEINSNK